MKKDLTTGNVTKTMLLFAGPMILGNLLQQCYNIVDMLIVGRAMKPIQERRSTVRSSARSSKKAEDIRLIMYIM